MKKLITILAALLLGCAAFNASAQLKITGEGESPKRLTTLYQMHTWLYSADGHFYIVAKTSNEFDSDMWFDLGDSKEAALESVTALLDILREKDKGEHITIESEGEEYLFTKETMLGVPFWMVTAVDTRNVYAGHASLDESMLKKAVKYFGR